MGETDHPHIPSTKKFPDDPEVPLLTSTVRGFQYRYNLITYVLGYRKVQESKILERLIETRKQIRICAMKTRCITHLDDEAGVSKTPPSA
jgi:hypothetical protein